ncbi:MAG TPA: ROK family protein [Acidimicrobiia bacterium]|nr:ROK family protein [Acidimicrobiia bacterium]
MADPVLGIDIGGSGIKANLVDLDRGEPVGERYKVDTPQPSVPQAVAEVVAGIVDHFAVPGPVGCTFPAVVRRGVTLSAANVDEAWIGTDADALFESVTGRQVTMVNDADAAGIAEMTFGAGRHRDGVVVCLTFGTGIGSALFTHRVLVPNTEFGHLNFAGFDSVEDWAAARVKDDEGLSWSAWGKRVNAYLNHLDQVFSPDLFILGGGISRKFSKFSQYLDVDSEIVPAELRNEAGIVGAAMAAAAL